MHQIQFHMDRSFGSLWQITLIRLVDVDYYPRHTLKTWSYLIADYSRVVMYSINIITVLLNFHWTRFECQSYDNWISIMNYNKTWKMNKILNQLESLVLQWVILHRIDLYRKIWYNNGKEECKICFIHIYCIFLVNTCGVVAT